MFVLVTGGAGFVGSHACKALARAGFTPVVYDNLSRGRREAVKWGPLEVGALEDRRRLDRVFECYRPLAVLHFAALAYVEESVRLPLLYYRNNVVGTLTLLESMFDAGCDKLVFSSSCATYGVPQRVPIPEDHPQAPINPYGRSKLMCEHLIADAGATSGLKSVVLRYFNAAGSDPEGEIGEEHEPETHLVPLVLQVAAGRRPEAHVFGEDYETPDGSCVRDYVHVADLADAHVLALQRLIAGHPSDVFNLGNGRGASVKEVIATAASVTGRAIPVARRARRQGDPPELIADATRARSILAWQPRWGSLKDQIGHAWQWQCRTANASGRARSSAGLKREATQPSIASGGEP